MEPERIEPEPGQESVWDYPRPPRVDPSTRHVEVYFAGELIADTRKSIRILETSHPPVYYIPRTDVRDEFLSENSRTTYCEYKGSARYLSIKVGDQIAEDAAWQYPEPSKAYASIAGYIAFHPAKVSACLVDGEVVQPQPGEFYGGWITSDIVGPFKGGPGTWGW